MRKFNVNVPDSVNFISDWTNYSIPKGHVIVDKGICGCGYTEWCITNNQPTIICSPRKILLENKKAQHPELNVYYFKNEVLTIDYEGHATNLGLPITNEDELNNIKNDLYNFIINSNVNNFTPKILVTYDSLKHVLDVINKTSINFQVVVDEWQAIFVDVQFKAETELNFVTELQNIPNVAYLSATPMLDKYLEMIPEFKNLDFYKLIWPKNKISTIRVNRKITRSINSEVSKWINAYRNGIYPKKIVNGIVHESKEAVFFVNSVKTICDIIKDNNLKPDECNILCSNTSTNRARLKKLKHNIGTVPLYNESHKMFTLCTRTVYLGADFYSTCASTIICSDCNINELTIDISLDLPQIMGRQRLKENVFRDEVYFIYKAAKQDESVLNKSKAEFDAIIEEKKKKSKIILEAYNNMTPEARTEYSAKLSRDTALYEYDFIGVDNNGIAKYNYLVEISNLRAWEVSRIDYQNDVCVRRGLEQLGEVNLLDISTELKDKYNQFKSNFINESEFENKMRLYCNYFKSYPKIFNIFKDDLRSFLPIDFENYMALLGPDKIISLSCRKSLLDIEINNRSIDISPIIYSTFCIGAKYNLSDIKDVLQKIYSDNNIMKTGKAIDLENWFIIKKITITNSITGKRENGYQIIDKK